MCLADTAYDANGLRQFLIDRGTLPVIPNNPTHKRPQPFDERLYRRRNVVERAVAHLKDWHRVATRCDRLASTYASAVALAIVIRWWC
jgi:putative transposase